MRVYAYIKTVLADKTTTSSESDATPNPLEKDTPANPRTPQLKDQKDPTNNSTFVSKEAMCVF